MHVKVFSIQIFQYLHQIPPRVCTLVLFIIDVRVGWESEVCDIPADCPNPGFACAIQSMNVPHM